MLSKKQSKSLARLDLVLAIVSFIGLTVFTMLLVLVNNKTFYMVLGEDIFLFVFFLKSVSNYQKYLRGYYNGK